MNTLEIRVGVVPLTDSAPFVVAQQMGFFQAENLSVRLVRQPSWATLRDNLAYGEIDAAHMLSPMVVALQAGLGGTPKKEVLAPLVLNRGGNALTLGHRLVSLVEQVTAGETLGDLIRREVQQGAPVPVFGTVFPFSMHTLQLRRWLARNEIDLSRDVRIEVVPPMRMVAALKNGRLDAFCVGEPYNTQAVEQGLGSIIATGQDLWPHAPEKVLGCTRAWAEQNPQALQGFVTALGSACQWLEASLDNRRKAAAWLSASDHVNLPQALLEKALLAMSEDGKGPFIQFDGSRADPGQLDLFRALAHETHLLVSNETPSAEELAWAVKPFGF